MPVKTEHSCIYEEKFQDHDAQLERLKARVDYKEDKINQIINDNYRMEKKIDKITESIHQLQLESAKDDFNIDNRVTALESTVKTLKWVVTATLAAIPIIITIITIIN